MMTFEEEFPSLKNKQCPLGGKVLHFHEYEIKQNCLDKQKVKDAIIKSRSHTHSALQSDKKWYLSEEILIKELELDN